jgi:hypothetical protein
MDRAIWAVWYDLPEEGNEAYLAWMHEEYLPRLKQRPGIAWVAHYRNVTNEHMLRTLHPVMARPDAADAGTGCGYIQLVGASDPLLLFSPSFIQQEARETGRDRQMLDRRIGPQSYAFGELFRVNGPELRLRPPGTTPGAAIQMGMLRLKHHEAKHALSSWYANNRLPLIAAMPGTISARVFSCLAGWPDFGVLYEFRSVQDRERSFEPQETDIAVQRHSPPDAHPIPVDQLIHAPGSPQAARRIWPPLD